MWEELTFHHEVCFRKPLKEANAAIGFIGINLFKCWTEIGWDSPVNKQLQTISRLEKNSMIIALAA